VSTSSAFLHRSSDVALVQRFEERACPPPGAAPSLELIGRVEATAGDGITLRKNHFRRSVLVDLLKGPFSPILLA
jgi:hypothetical protein